MSEKILIYDEAQRPFDAEAVEQAFRTVAGMSSIRTSPEVVSAVEADHETDAGTCIVRLISSCKMIAIEGSLDAIAESVFALKNSLNHPLHVIDEAYSFDFPVNNMSSSQRILEELLASTAE